MGNTQSVANGYNARAITAKAYASRSWKPVHISSRSCEKFAHGLYVGTLRAITSSYGVWVAYVEIVGDLAEVRKEGEYGYIDRDITRREDRLWLIDPESYKEVNMIVKSLKDDMGHGEREQWKQRERDGLMEERLAILAQTAREKREDEEKDRRNKEERRNQRKCRAGGKQSDCQEPALKKDQLKESEDIITADPIKKADEQTKKQDDGKQHKPVKNNNRGTQIEKTETTDRSMQTEIARTSHHLNQTERAKTTDLSIKPTPTVKPSTGRAPYAVVCTKGLGGLTEIVMTTASLEDMSISPVLGRLVLSASRSYSGFTVLHLSNTDASTFYMLCHWHKHGIIGHICMTDSGVKFLADNPADVKYPSYKRLVDLWKLGRFLRCEGVLRAVVEAVIEKSAVLLPDVHEIQYLYRTTDKEDMMRKLYRDVMVFQMGPGDAVELVSAIPSDFYVGVAAELRDRVINDKLNKMNTTGCYLKGMVGFGGI